MNENKPGIDDMHRLAEEVAGDAGLSRTVAEATATFRRAAKLCSSEEDEDHRDE